MSDESVSLGFVGDVCPATGVIDTLRSEAPGFLFEAVRPLYDARDLIIANLETCVSETEETTDPASPKIAISTKTAECLLDSGIDIFGLANNHILDLGAAGLRDTLAFLKRHKLRHFGAGMTLDEAEAPLIVEVKGRRIALLGACDVTTIWAGPDSAGVAPLKEDRLMRRLGEAKALADLVVFVLHADIEFVRHPAPWRQRLSRKLIDHGAAMVIQHHPHVCQGVEVYKERVIAYSLGNHVFDLAGYQEGVPGTDLSMLLEVEVTGSGDRVKTRPTIHPLKLDEHHRPVASNAELAARQMKSFDDMNAELLKRETMRSEWRRSCVHQIREHVTSTYYTLRRDGLGAALRDQVWLMRSGARRRWVYGFLSAGFW
jgi:hypothetical protein